MFIKLVEKKTGLILSVFEMQLADATIRGYDFNMDDSEIKCNVAHFISVKGDHIYVKASAEDVSRAIVLAMTNKVGELRVSLEDYIINPREEWYIFELLSGNVGETPGFDNAIASMLGGDIIQ